MATRGAIVRIKSLTPLRFSGTYHHYDSYPTGLGKTLWDLYHDHFAGNLAVMLDVLIDRHPAGRSTVYRADFDKQPGFRELDSEVASRERAAGERPAPSCYCHGDRHETSHPVTQNNAVGSGCEYVYAFGDHNKLLVFKIDDPIDDEPLDRDKKDSCFRLIGDVDLDGAEPGWYSMERSG